METALHRDRNYIPVDWVQVVVTLDRPTPESLAGCNRKEKFNILLENARRHRTELVQWIQEHDLSSEVARIGAPTSFHLLFVQCTLHAATQLVNAPGVVDVAVEDEVQH
ncbi:MAG: hypothetical protein R3E79_62235 [Caldilineaceae bacterium]